MKLSSIFIIAQTFATAVQEKRHYAISDTETVWLTEEEILAKGLVDPKYHHFVDITDGTWDDLQQNPQSSFAPPQFPTVMQNQALVNKIGATVQRSYIQGFLEKFTSFKNRYYQSSYGKSSAEFLFQEVQKLAPVRSNVKFSARKFEHSWGQFSIIARLEAVTGGTDSILILGAHQDSINRSNAQEGVAPGVDGMNY
jgi:leucyl aminopeptidase